MADKKPQTLVDRRGKLKRLVDVLAGYARLPEPHEADDYARCTAIVRAANIVEALSPIEAAGRIQDPLYDAYQLLKEASGLRMAGATMAATSAWLKWCHDRRSRRIVNWVASIRREAAPGRIRAMSWEEIGALVQASDELALPFVGDAVILAVDLSWSECDILALEWPRIVQGADGRWRPLDQGRQKTGRKGAPPFLSMGQRRLNAIRQRNSAAGIAPLKVIYMPRQYSRKRSATADAFYFQRAFAKVRGQAALSLASVADLTFADTRDTGFTLTKQARLTDDETASRTRQSRKNIAALGDKHYGEIGQEIADSAADRLDPYIEAAIKKAGLNL